MKKILAILVALGLIFGGGVSTSVQANAGDYDWPIELIPPA